MMLETLTVGTWVYANRHEGICVGHQKSQKEWYRSAVLSLTSNLFDVDGWETIVGIVARHLGAPEDDVVADVLRCKAAIADDLIVQWWGGGSNALRGKETLTYEEFLEAKAAEDLREAARAAKKLHSKRRRQEFGAARSQLVLAMLDAGTPYICAHPGCAVSRDLTVDHKTALSRGGGDDLGNLQFMCVSHNSKKRDGP